MVMDYHQYHIKPVRAVLSWVTSPFSFALNWPIKTYHHLQTSIVTQETLLHENQRLQAEIMSLQLRMQKLLSIEQENKQLRALMRSSLYVQTKVKVGQIVAIATNPAVQEVAVDFGKEANIFLGQPVLDSFGVFGQVIQASNPISRVMLLTDSRSAIPVEDARSGFRAIAEGSSEGSVLQLSHVPKTADIRVNDVFVTSGLGGVYPEGYPVGEVLSSSLSPGSQFASITLKPSAHLHRSRLLLLVWLSSTNSNNKKEGEL